jgi:hypothetical protein
MIQARLFEILDVSGQLLALKLEAQEEAERELQCQAQIEGNTYSFKYKDSLLSGGDFVEGHVEFMPSNSTNIFFMSFILLSDKPRNQRLIGESHLRIMRCKIKKR